MPLTQPETRTPFVTLFDDTYDQPDCRGYYRMLRSLGYSNHAHAVSVFRAVLDRLMEVRGIAAPDILDFASSYGIVTALMKHEVSATEFLDRYEDGSLDTLTASAMEHQDRSWLERLPARYPGARFTGLDVATNAVRYGKAVGLFDHGFDEDLEQNAPSPALSAQLAEVDLIVECGSVAHLMPTALDRLLGACGECKPWVVTSPVRGNERIEAFDVLRDHGLVIDTLGLQPFPHRRFDSASEQARAMAIAEAAGHDTSGFETTGYFFAQIYLARPASEAQEVFPDLSSVQAGR
ncbi:hypothetical protein FIU86_17195 [Roseovarius sp. THAF9]|uniref:hypothetical protein n=1 Tax=Roseovarius sp. THAF9 TaxID=2587847 RepID=UPI001267A3F5|nr:hypothetical protein [Roseovarius sp. THAF9]QFT94591.1 hypothetical protein FIU86_17195 [Roseovarius sp. THAF9]